MTLDRARLKADIVRLLGEDGVLARRLAGFAHRPGQLQMALDVADALCDGAPIIAEGGTGIGKTLAYLLPAILSGRKTVVATGTKTLQEQIFYKDLPVLLDALDQPVKATYMKGRQNYLCKLRYEQFAAQRLFRFAGEGALFEEIDAWSRITETGDRSELTSLPDDYAAWNELTSTADNCLGARCRHYNACFVTKMRRRAQEADLIIVNHHLYFADLAVREREFGEVIPRHEVAIFDEAHLLENAATQHFGVAVSNLRLYAFADDVGRWLGGKREAPAVGKTLEEIKTDATRLFMGFGRSEGRFRLSGDTLEAALAVDEYDRLLTHLDLAGRQLDSMTQEHEEAAPFAARGRALAADLEFVLGRRREDYVYWGEARRRSLTLAASPLDVAPLMRERYLSRGLFTVYTSATLSAGGSFAYFKERLGLGDEAREGVYPSPFDYRHQSLLYIPRQMPEPASSDFTARAAQEIEALIRLSGGGALVLFTSYANLDDVWRRLDGRLDVPMLRQGDAPRIQLLETFRDAVNSVLFATGTFWQGVDVLGPSLRLVIIDKLPFESPGEPITEARIQYLREQGKNPFADYQTPTAIIQLRQGAGRLIRDRTDWGVIALLDRRVVTKGYGRKFLASLPPSVRTEKFKDVAAWWRRRMGIAEMEATENSDA